MDPHLVQIITRFGETFGAEPDFGCSVPGRVELCGNHTDHQHGHVVAAAIDLNMLAAVRKRQDDIVHLYSEQFGAFQVHLNDLAPQAEERGTSSALVRGVAAWLAEQGHAVGGFEAYISSDIPAGSGLSSSAAFEVLIAGILDHLYGCGSLAPQQLAFAAQYAENAYFGKPCGLMDQLACATGGVCAIDFAQIDQPKVQRILLDCADYDHQLYIVHTHGSHAQLTDEYAAIPQEMISVAHAMGKNVLRECDETLFYQQLPLLRKTLSDRALLRAHHFFGENARAAQLIPILQQSDFPAFLQTLRNSGASSAQYLQNVFVPSEPDRQEISLALACSECFLQGEGAVRVHGGGFAGTILAIVPKRLAERYALEMDALFGKGSALPLRFRPAGFQLEF